MGSSFAHTAYGYEGSADRKIQHVFVIVLENEGFDVTFGPNSKAPFLSKVLGFFADCAAKKWPFGQP
jgi:phospholipase C